MLCESARAEFWTFSYLLGNVIIIQAMCAGFDDTNGSLKMGQLGRSALERLAESLVSAQVVLPGCFKALGSRLGDE